MLVFKSYFYSQKITVLWKENSPIRLRGEFSQIQTVGIDQLTIDRLQLALFVICHFKYNA